MNPPRFPHDCARCRYLGPFHKWDLYYCPVGGLPDTVIARYGENGEDYTSGVALSGLHPALAEARYRTIDLEIAIVASPPRDGPYVSTRPDPE